MTLILTLSYFNFKNFNTQDLESKVELLSHG